MPEYEYRCKTCGHIFTLKRRMGQAQVVEACPDCAGEARRLFSLPHVAQFIPANANDPEQWR